MLLNALILPTRGEHLVCASCCCSYCWAVLVSACKACSVALTTISGLFCAFVPHLSDDKSEGMLCSAFLWTPAALGMAGTAVGTDSSSLLHRGFVLANHLLSSGRRVCCLLQEPDESPPLATSAGGEGLKNHSWSRDFSFRESVPNFQ